MTIRSLDELVAPAPPYRMARPVATAVSAPSDFRNDSLQKGLERIRRESAPPVVEKPQPAEMPPAPAEKPPTPEMTAHERVAEAASRVETILRPEIEASHPELKVIGDTARSLVARAKGTWSPKEVAAASRVVQEVISKGGKVVELPGGKAVAVTPAEGGGERVRQLQGNEAPIEAGQPGKPKEEAVADVGSKRVYMPAIKPEIRTPDEPVPTKLPKTAETEPSLTAKEQEEGLEVSRLRPSEQPVRPEEVGRQKELTRGEQKKIEQEQKVVNAIRERTEQERLAEEMAKEPEKKLEQESIQKIPRPERVGVAFKMREALRYVVEKSGTKPWWDTLTLRANAWFKRGDIAWDAYRQSRVQSKLDIANERITGYRQKMKDAGILSKVFYGDRLRAWQKRAGTLESKVSGWNGRRERSIQQHNAFQKEIAHRYERELVPYRELVRDYAGRLEVQQKTRDTLAKKRDEALAKLTEAEIAGKKGRWFMGPRARKAVTIIREQIKEMDRRIAVVDSASDGLVKRLNKSQSAADAWENKKKVVMQLMEFPEHEGLKRTEHVSGAGRPESVEVAREERSPKAGARTARLEAPTPPEEQDPSAKIWDVLKFAASWNGLGLERIEDPKAFADYITSERDRLRMKGEPTAQQLLDLAEPYLVKASTVKISPKQLKRDRQFFLDNAS